MSSMKKLLQYIKPYTLFALLGPLLMCIEVAMVSAATNDHADYY